MYLSCLLIDVGDNPDRPRPGRTWLRNLYHVHQRLCMAFPSAARKADDCHFLKPFNPDDFGVEEPKQVHVKRCSDAGFLFRIDPQAGGRVAVLVQSAAPPDWDYAFHNAGYFLAAPPQVKPFAPCFAVGQQWRFCLVANPIRTVAKTGPDALRRNGKGKGMRVPVPAFQFYQWLARRAEPAGFSVAEDFVSAQPGYIYVNSKRDGPGQRLRSVRYEGLLKITEPVQFQKTLIQGIGPGKAFGFGLLSLGRIAP